MESEQSNIENLLDITIKNLKKNRIESIVMQSSKELIKFIDSQIADSSVVGVGDSMTLETTGIYDYLRSRKLLFLDKYNKTLSREDKRALYLKNFDADYFLCSANAISCQGKIYNMDGNGSRVAPVIYGPKNVFIVCGINKIVEDEPAAIERIKKIAAPIDAKRLGKKTPCAITGQCEDCKSPDKICNYLTVIQGQFDKNRIKVIFINENLGF